MSYSYGVSRGVAFNGNVITDTKPLRGVWSVNAPAWELVQYNGLSPAQVPRVQYYPEIGLISNTYVVFEGYGTELFRQSIRELRTSIVLPESVMAVATSLFNDTGRAAENLDTFTINVYAPIGVGFYWFPRSVIWEFPSVV